MTLATFDAFDAFETALSGADDLPTLKRHDSSLEGFDDSGTAGVKFKLAMEEGDFEQYAFEMGEPPAHELWVEAMLTFAVEGVAGPDRDAVLRAGVASLAGVMFPDGRGLRVAGKFDNLRVDRIGRRLIQPESGRLPIDLIDVEFALFLTAPTPFG